MPFPIIFTAHYGDQKKQVKISEPHGAADTLHLMIDNFHCGQFVRSSGRWAFYPTDRTIQGDDVYVLEGIVEEEFNPEIIS